MLGLEHNSDIAIWNIYSCTNKFLILYNYVVFAFFRVNIKTLVAK